MLEFSIRFCHDNWQFRPLVPLNSIASASPQFHSFTGMNNENKIKQTNFNLRVSSAAELSSSNFNIVQRISEQRGVLAAQAS